jgi:site-specific recombinase XerD
MHDIPRVKNSKKLPSLLSFSEITSILDATTNLKHKAILMTAYSAGLRVSEVLALKVSDIHSENMQIHVRSGKGDF